MSPDPRGGRVEMVGAGEGPEEAGGDMDAEEEHRQLGHHKGEEVRDGEVARQRADGGVKRDEEQQPEAVDGLN